VPTLFTTKLLETLARFPPGSLRLEIGIQTLNPEVAARICLPRQTRLPGRQTFHPCDKILETLRFLREKTNAIIHADLIAGLPGETLESFAKGFDQLVAGTFSTGNATPQVGVVTDTMFEIQLGILKQLPGTPITRHTKEWGMKYNPDPPYEVLETSTMNTKDLDRLKNFARFWEIIVNRGCGKGTSYLVENSKTVNFHQFMELSDALLARFGKNWGIDKDKLLAAILEIHGKMPYI